MGELWRSDDMELIQLYIQNEAAHDTIEEIGKLGVVQFRDMNTQQNAFQRHFIGQVKKADEILRRLKDFQHQIELYNIDAEINGRSSVLMDDRALELRITMDELEARTVELESQVAEMNSNHSQIVKNYHELIEIGLVLDFKFKCVDAMSSDKEEDSFFHDRQSDLIKLGTITGMILSSRCASFEKVLFRAAHGNLLLKYEEVPNEIVDLADGSKKRKSVFLIYSQGERLNAKLLKLCETFSASVYNLPKTKGEKSVFATQLSERLNMLRVLQEKGRKQKEEIFNEIGSQLMFWKARVLREKLIYHTTNKFNFDLGRHCLIGEAWCPAASLDDVQAALRVGRERSGSSIPSVLDVIRRGPNDIPPTRFRTNKVTKGFQEIVSAYGVARYKEINPAVFTVVTFPFQFGVMFGDVGHGLVLFLLAIGMIYKERHWEGKKLNEFVEILYSGRYTLLLCSLWSIYIGSLYNECFALPMNFGSNYKIDPTGSGSVFTWKDQSWTYRWGVDPIWKGATNELLFYNSLKMKTSVIIGVLQMTLGLFLHLFNSLHFRNALDVWFEFLPRVIFLWCTFGYLVVIIFLKWNTNYFSPVDRTNASPGLLNVMINMVLGGDGSTESLYRGQATCERVLVILAVLCVPMMFLPKPAIIHLSLIAERRGLPGVWALIVSYMRDKSASLFQYNAQEKKRKKDKRSSSDEDDIIGVDRDDSILLRNMARDGRSDSRHSSSSRSSSRELFLPSNLHQGHGEDGEGMVEVWVHQGLETIEFVLGCISHTASYLRLWALSLAHSELATVFYDKIVSDNWNIALVYGANHGGFFNFVLLTFFSFVGVSVWLAATLFVILSMESLSAFLHALRLHWVEFQSKFYKGDGHAFKPLVFRSYPFHSADDDV